MRYPSVSFLQTGKPPSAFAFPGGAVPPGADRVLRAAGIRLAFTTSAGITAPDAPDWLALERINQAFADSEWHAKDTTSITRAALVP